MNFTRVAISLLGTLSYVTSTSCSFSPSSMLSSKRLKLEEYALLGPILRDAADDCNRHLPDLTSLKLTYSLFEGRSALRELVSDDISCSDDRHDNDESNKDNCSAGRLLRPSTYGIFHPRNEKAFHRSVAILLLLRDPRKYADVAHELVLGVTPHNIPQAEYAKTNRSNPKGKEWNDAQLPFDASSDLIHAAIHRLEGNLVGEGGYTGWENAKYWLGGGPKMLDNPHCIDHDARRKLAEWARENTPLCVKRYGIISGHNRGNTKSDDATMHTIIAGGGETRTIHVPCGEWDGFAFCDVCKLRSEGGLDKDVSKEVGELQMMELLLLLEHELVEAGFG